MQLYLIRHAIAEERAPGLPDEGRALTLEGRSRMKQEMRGLRRLGISFERLAHSPLRRALETAEILAPLVEGKPRVSALLAQAPGPALLDSLAGESLALVGHDPWLSQLAGLLIGGTPALTLKKGGVLVLEGEARAGGMRLVQSLAPATLRALGED